MKEINERNKNSLIKYALIILLTVNITFFITKGSSDSTFVENFNFASTITSIILSVVAIIYTFVDSSQSKSVSEKIIDSAENLKCSTENLEKVGKDIEVFVENISSFEKRILGTVQNESASTKELLVERVDERMNEIMRKIDENKVGLNKKDILSLSDNMEDFIIGLSDTIKQYCLLTYRAYKEDTELNIIEYNQFYNKELIREGFGEYDITEGFMTYIEIFKGLNLIQFEFNDYRNLVIKYLNPQLETLVNTLLPSEGYYSDSREFRHYGTVYEFFKTKK
ncbi:hypothetical protein [Paraclostridium sordellii]|uniref:hypothetical protein n=1 Tax=Paraclostridium sordellii TaxID=1505 RepID=UPI0022E1903E|nr:hypothetical protein [Paeniclostridium sordellii]